MGRHTELLKAAKDNNYTKMLELFNNKNAGKGLSKLRGLAANMRKKDKDVAPVWPLNPDGSIQKLEKPTHLKMECRDAAGNTPLIIAALAGNVEVVECLTAYGANINTADSKGNTALSLASFSVSTRTEAVVETLIKNNADVKVSNQEGSNALHHACQFGRTYVLMMLLDANGDPHAKNGAGETPLDIAARYDRREVVSFLLDHDNELAKSTKSLREATRAGKKEVVKLLLDYGMDPGSQDPETGDTALHISVRFFRVELTETLLSYGADAYTENNAGEKPQTMVEQYPAAHEHRAKILGLIEEYKEKAIVTPAIELDRQEQRKAKDAVKRRGSTETSVTAPTYPVLKPQSSWVPDKPTDKICSAFVPTCPPRNVLDGNTKTYWLARGTGRQWLIFDFGKPYTLAKMVLRGGRTKEMPKEFQLEMSPGPEGPWRVVTKGDTGPFSHAGGDYQCETEIFTGTSRYWKLMILRNHGAHETHTSVVEFHGVDHLLKKWCTENGFAQYYDEFVTNGFNQVASFAKITDEQLSEIVPLVGHRRKVLLAQEKLRGPVTAKLDKLVFATQPPSDIICDEVIEPPITVFAAPGLSDELELVVDGAVAQGEMRAKLVQRGKNPSSASFPGISLSPEGKCTIEVRSVANPEVYVRAVKPSNIVPPRSRHAIEALFMEFDTLVAF
eukprot:m.350356 g.350356  ORF g.350356 m.350356 type:complete len:674 (-) comp16579_c0_seq12:67-2088(-)